VSSGRGPVAARRRHLRGAERVRRRDRRGRGHRREEVGTVATYDLRCRPSLWLAIGGLTKARGVEVEVEEADASLAELQVDEFAAMVAQAVAAHPNLKVGVGRA